MKAKPKRPAPADLFRARLVEIIDMRHELVKLAALIDWEFFEREWARPFVRRSVRPRFQEQEKQFDKNLKIINGDRQSIRGCTGHT